jgi:hypothetical protein
VLALKRLSRFCNIIPLIAKADTLTRDELADFKKRINEVILFMTFCLNLFFKKVRKQGYYELLFKKGFFLKLLINVGFAVPSN